MTILTSRYDNYQGTCPNQVKNYDASFLKLKGLQKTGISPKNVSNCIISITSRKVFLIISISSKNVIGS